MVDHILLIGRMGSGKSTLASQMAPEYLVLNFDGRWVEQNPNVSGKYHLISNADPIVVVNEMEKKRPGLASVVQSVIVDSGTQILDYVQSYDRLKNADAGDKKWMNEAFKRKADTMRVLAGAVMRWNCSTCWIFHIEDSMQGGKAQIRQTIPNAELERLKKSLNVILEVFQDKKGRAVKIVWTRYNDNKAEGQIIRDTEGMWKGVLPKVSEFIREFTGTEGYNGNAYSKEWLYTFLQSKGKEYKSIEHMVKELGLEQEPRWFDRNAWGEIIKKAGVE